tara:strand:+ start:13078 stop:13482 length:405 start_codon:yes stop_codon:yes gene_type:complete
MIGQLNHVAIAVPDLEIATKFYKNTLGANVSDALELPDHGVKTVFVKLQNTKIELLEPIDSSSPISKFLHEHPNGGIHHICYQVEDIKSAISKLVKEGARVLGTGKPDIGAHGKPVIFLHPKDCLGTLVELEEA